MVSAWQGRAALIQLHVLLHKSKFYQNLAKTKYSISIRNKRHMLYILKQSLHSTEGFYIRDLFL